MIPDNSISVLDHGFVRLDEAMADDLSVANAARVSFARRKEELDEADEGLIRFLMRDRHGTPFEHNAFRFHIRSPIFVAREWFRHRIGCLTGDTVVTFVDSDGHASRELAKTVDELWQLWTGGEHHRRAPSTGHEPLAPGRTRHTSGRPSCSDVAEVLTDRAGAGPPEARSRLGRLRVLDEDAGEFTSGELADVIDKGVQPVYRLTLADGKTLTVTENHRLLTSTGWQRMRAAVGLTGAGAGARLTASCALMTNGAVSVAPRAHRRTGLAADLAPPSRRSVTLRAHPVRVVSIAYLGLRQTYDLSVAGPWHNFVANGIVVHNSFNEFSLRYAKATDDFYVPAAEDVRTQVGKPGAYTFERVDPALAEQTREELRAVYEQAFSTYERLVEAGVARELARSALPVGAYTQFYWTLNARALMNFVSLRNSEFAQLEIRRYGEAVETFLAEKMPVTHAAFVENGRIAP